MKNKLPALLALVFLALFNLSSCRNYEQLKSDPRELGDIELIEGLSFAQVRDEVLIPKCVSCHKNYHLNYDDYEIVKDRIDLIVKRVSDGSMPEDGVLEDNLKAMLLSWAQQGAPLGEDSDTVGVEPAPSDELTATWESVNRNIFRKKCVSCHNPSGIYSQLPFTSRSDFWDQRDLLFNFKEPEKSYIVEVIADPFEPMPPPWSSLPKVTEEELKVLKEWIGQGLP